MEDEKKDATRVTVIGTSQMFSAQAALYKQLKELENLKIAFIKMEASCMSADKTGKALREQIKDMDLIDICKDIDFSKVEKIIIDSIEKNGLKTKLVGQIHDSVIADVPKEYEEQKPQKEIWANSWNKKIKRKL